MADNARRPVLAGRVLGIVTFLGGIALLLWTFGLAYSMFTVPHTVQLGIQEGKPVDLPRAGEALVGVVLRILLLLVMAILGSLIANRGVKMYDTQTHPSPPIEPKAPKE